jgi:quercetin dioxygenase-like cupin family protein
MSDPVIDYAHLHPTASGFLEVKTVPKPWGHEAWLVVTPQYVMKHLYVSKGQALSYQYHREKTETLTVLEGACLVTLSLAGEAPASLTFSKGQVLHLMPGTRHSFKALEDLVLAEVSTPELDDVVRLEDLYGRK